MEDIKEIRIEEFDYELPDERIAKHPLSERDRCKLLVADRAGRPEHHRFDELPELLGERKPLMICNETRVINARMEFHKETGSRIEIFLLEPYRPVDYAQSFAETHRCVWTGLVGNLKKWKGGPLTKRIEIEGREVTLQARLLDEMPEGEHGGTRYIELEWTGELPFATIVEAAGNIPIPPYLNRESEEGDRDDYQTVYSRVKGSVAAPTAGLHFTTPLLERLADTGVEIEKVTLHVGAGTFKPVKSATIGDHPMHTESVSVPLHVIESLITAIETGRPVLAVGTTSVRTLESLPYFGRLARTRDVSDRGEMHIDQWMAYEDRDEDTLTLLRTLRDAMKSHGEETLNGSTQIMIAPGFGWRVVDMMVTNFHQPQSTLLLLVSSFLEPGSDKPQVWRRAYDAALDADFRFLSYGDACLFYRI
ncbi:MAG: S-adenosylmethionine:tRNA ribosyltransferase-isomerase [Muribaculaceae bacterium]|nr:S-adenosylmethionine:tRNA ribosyltransferase-isomerase [Muribaculaceae bacterium]